MSMVARFVAIAPHQLAALQERPEMVGGMFALEAERPLEDPEHMQQRLMFQQPRLIVDMLSRLAPDARQRVRRQLQVREDGRPGPGANRTLLLQLAQREAARQREAPGEGAPGHSITLEKAWHGIHYLLSGAIGPTPEPRGQAVFGGDEIGDGGSGYGPARCLAPPQVTEIAAALHVRGVITELKARFDTGEMTRLDIYPGTWENSDRRWLLGAFRTLRNFYAAASTARRAVVTVIE